MKKATILLLFALFSACSIPQENLEVETSSTPLDLGEGTYSGKFYQTYPGQSTLEFAEVSLGFFNGHFSGTSDIALYPALCEGTYSRPHEYLIEFQNACFFTANFDWSLIIDGRYQVKYEKDAIHLVQKMSNGFENHFIITKD
ncbi:hypothetical protein QWY31_11180 [Cytophagales bacterium LB-30]|uniref:Lipoprotein n=1 Tax=Shiella aurantiaca TaxID=3058365 RepID=A0ABT8F707_9BACT|nr:hypothetical protein [Shiella aurantiaca]MDN4166068.1 hypothetical protein [Shiella aurantiaca]